jgi:hypothetical protein
VYCPSCGIQTSSDQKYCRSGGMDLQMIFLEVGKHLGQIIQKSEALLKNLERWGTITGLIGLSMLALFAIGFIICFAISKVFGMDIDAFGFETFAPVVFTIAICLMMTGLALRGYSKEQGKPRPAKLTGKAQTTAELSVSNDSEQMPSITECTTNLLATGNSDSGRRTKRDLRD